jgi:hypothetical protein
MIVEFFLSYPCFTHIKGNNITIIKKQPVNIVEESSMILQLLDHREGYQENYLKKLLKIDKK